MRSTLAVVLALVAAGVIWQTLPAATAPVAAEGVKAAPEPTAIHTQAEFDALLARTGGDLLLDFSATWCGPCRMLAPQLATFAHAHPGTVVVTIDVDEVPTIAEHFAIQAMPTLIHLRQRVEVKRAVGYRDAAGIAAWMTSTG